MSSNTSRLKSWLIDAFPVPNYMMMPAVALDISPNSVKYLDYHYSSGGCLPRDFKEVFLPEGTIVDGMVKDMEALTNALKEVRAGSSRKFTFVAIPENAIYLYTIQINGRPNHSAIMQQIEFSFSEHVPLPLDDAVYDFDTVGVTRNTVVVSVTAAPKELIVGYERALAAAGFSVRSIELEAYAVARSVTKNTTTASPGVEMIVDVGYSRAGIIIVKNNIPIFSITTPGGGKQIDRVLEECKQQYAFWDTRTNAKGKRVERVSKVTLTGGASKELFSPLGEALGREVEQADIWQNLFDINEHIPSIDATMAQGMSTLAGLLVKNKQ
jgi:type IV pilus assembly protein PilM